MLKTRYAAAILTVLILAIVGTGTTVVVLHFNAVADGASTRCFDPCFAKPSPVLQPQPDSPATVTATQAGIEQALAAYVSRPELGTVAASVIDHNSGKVLWQHQGEAAMVPASVTKVSTAVAALSRRGPQYRIPTIVVAGSQPGEVILVGGGDVTLAAGRTGYYPGAASLTDLAEQVRRAYPQPISKLVVDTSLYSGPGMADGWDGDVVSGGFGIPAVPVAVDGGRVAPRGDNRVSAPDQVAGQQLAALLPGGSHIQVSVSGQRVERGRQLGLVQSPPISRLVEVMLQQSDNVIADSLAHQVAVAHGQQASFGSAVTAVLETLRGLGIDLSGVQLFDGSGLSRNDRLTTDLLAHLIHVASEPEHPELRAVLSGLPIAGFSGTLRNRFGSPSDAAAISDVRAKTGSLTQVSSLAGTLTTSDGEILEFAFIANNFPMNGGDSAELALDHVVGALARCGCK